MKGESIRTWDAFCEFQFRRHIQKAFQTGARIVVLGFDNYAHVPSAKNMTQRKRMKDVEVLEFTAEQALPSFIPDNWMSAIKNRTFKTKVIGLVLRHLRSHFKDDAVNTLVIDYMGAPEVLGKPIELPAVFHGPGSSLHPGSDEHAAHAHNLRRGECDIKAFAWMSLGPLLIESTDGDFIPIALLQLRECEIAGQPARLALHRIKTKLPSEATKLQKAGPDLSQQKRREYEFVDVNKLYEYLRSSENAPHRIQLTIQASAQTPPQAFASNKKRRILSGAADGNKRDIPHIPHIPTQQVQDVEMQEVDAPGADTSGTPVIAAIDVFSSLVAMTGCDFCMSLPQLGPIRLWQLRHLWKYADATSECGHLVFVTLALCDVNGKALRHAGKYADLVMRAKASTTVDDILLVYIDFYNIMQRQSGVALSVRNRLWKSERMHAHVKNTHWTLQYWRLLHMHTDPLDGEHGFVRKGKSMMFGGV